jgi:hypothetical protein
MYFTLNGKHLSLNNSPIKTSFASLDFSVDGEDFPYTYYDSIYEQSYSVGYVYMESSTPNKVTINYGDGNILTYPFVLNGGLYKIGWTHKSGNSSVVPVGCRIPHHTYTDGNSGKRVIRMSFENISTVISFKTWTIRIHDIFPSDIDKMINLNDIRLSYTRRSGNGITAFPLSIANNKSINTLHLENIGIAITNSIPDVFFSLYNIKDVSFSSSIDMSNIYSSNLYKVNVWKNTLKSLGIGATKLTELPEEIRECTKLTHLHINSNKFITIPPQLNSLINLEYLSIGAGAGTPLVIDWGDISSLTKLSYINYYYAQMSPPLPPYFNMLVGMKYMLNRNCYRTQERSDEFVNSLYGVVVSNAPINGTSSDAFRNMTINYYTATDTEAFMNRKPTGTYQQPVGYVQGSNNGTPASPQEKIWVMVNQYKHLWLLHP